MAMTHSTAEALAYAGYASSGKEAHLAGDPGNLKFNESPLKLLETALKDMLAHSKLNDTERSVDLVIGIAGYDFYRKKAAPNLEQLTQYRYTMHQNCQGTPNKEAFFSCMARAIFSEQGFQVESIKIVG